MKGEVGNANALLFSPWESKLMREAVIRGVRPGEHSGFGLTHGLIRVAIRLTSERPRRFKRRSNPFCRKELLQFKGRYTRTAPEDMNYPPLATARALAEGPDVNAGSESISLRV